LPVFSAGVSAGLGNRFENGAVIFDIHG
jgi:hypothetical protein